MNAEDPRDALALSPRVPAISYSFARKHGVLLRFDGERAVASLRDGADPAILIEVRRNLDGEMGIERVSEAAFDQLLSSAYAMNGDAAAAAADTLRSGGELDLIASGIPTAEDLLDSADDAPAIRLNWSATPTR